MSGPRPASVPDGGGKTDLEIARSAAVMPIGEVASKLDIPEWALIPCGRDKAKLDYRYLDAVNPGTEGRLILVTAMSPTLAGEGKTTVSVGLADALWRMGRRTVVCLREPSLGPCFGMKGGAAGGGRAQVIPMEDINLHFTGDFHAIGAANNLLAAMVDNHLHWDNPLALDPRRVTWRRAVDMNDRSLRNIVCGLGGALNGVPHETGFDISVASEVMAVFCLATSLEDLQRRLGDMIVGYTQDRVAITARQLNAQGAMTALLRDAFQPNLVQTLENNPALIHGGPFANIAHGCSSVIATQTAQKLADYVVTEAGFGADLGAEKFFNIKCRSAGLSPEAAVMVATTRALKQNGGVARSQLDCENVEAVRLGCNNLGRHVENVAKFGVPVVVTINRFASDTEEELAAVAEFCAARDTPCVVSSHWADGGGGAMALAREVTRCVDTAAARFKPLYPDSMGLWDKVKEVAGKIYGASGVVADRKVHAELDRLERQGYGHLPVCLAKTPYSFSADPKLFGAPSGHELPVREVRLAAGAGFVIAICGDVMTMPGLPRRPAAEGFEVTADRQIAGLF